MPSMWASTQLVARTLNGAQYGLPDGSLPSAHARRTLQPTIQGMA